MSTGGTGSHNNLAGKTVLVTGAAGFIGSHLTERCLELGWRVIGVDAFTDYYSRDLKLGNLQSALEHREFTLLEGNLLDLDLEAILSDVSIVFHLAAQAGVRPSWDSFETYATMNVTATQRLMHAARDAQLERFVMASTSSIYGDAEALPTHEDVLPQPVSPYGVTKLATEHLARIYCRDFGVPIVCLRYFTVYGPRQRPDMAFNKLIRCALGQDEFAVYGDGEQTRDFTFVADAVTGTVAAGQVGKPGVAYNIGGGSRRSLNSVLDTLDDLLGSTIRRRYSERQRGDARHTAADIRRARKDLGFEPAFEFSAGLKAQLDWQMASLAQTELAR